jgi:hypothetical protein
MISLFGPSSCLPIDAEVLPRLVRPARDHQAPGDQRRGVARPAGLDRQAAQIDVFALPHDLLAGCRGHDLGRHVEHLLEHRQLVPGVPQALGRLGFLEVGQQFADGAQAGLPVAAAIVGSAPMAMPMATRSGVPNRLASTGMAWPFGFSNSRAGPPARSTRSAISVISSTGSTSTAMRLSWPMASSWRTKSRRSAYFIFRF